MADSRPAAKPTTATTSSAPVSSAGTVLPVEDSTRSVRRGVYLLLAALSLGSLSGRLLAVNSVDKIRLEERLKKEGRADWVQQRPFLSGNDRSRWCTIRALVEHGTYAIDEIIAQPNWDTIDMVKHYDRQGQPKLYSSKPALLPTLLAGEYWLLHRATGWTLGTHPYELGRMMLFTVNVLPLAWAFCLLARMLDRLGTSDWGRILAFATATGGTMLTTFGVVLNNHLVAAVSATVALEAAVRIWFDDCRQARTFALCGAAAAFTAANELPALAFFGLLGVCLLWKAPRPTLLFGVPAALVVVAAFAGTEYAAHGSVRLAYSHRDPGKTWEEGNWYNYTYQRNGRTIESYWSNPANKSKVDQGEPSAAAYVFHVLVGHHGIFSLTPIWLLLPVGLGFWWQRDAGRYRVLVLWILLCTLACLAFYLTRDQVDRNYGGMTSGFRWMFWFVPLWVVGLLPAADWAASRCWARWTSAVLLGLSALSAAYPTWNPWSQPWIVNWLIWAGRLDW